MGRRHQVYIIAKVNYRYSQEKEYCCVAAFHFQSLHGEQVVRAAVHFITAVKNPLNRRLIQADLETFDNYKARACYGRAIPCPYITMLYMKSANVGVDDNVIQRCYPEDARGLSGSGDNSEGITIFDVTDPASPRYCMVSIDYLLSPLQPSRGIFHPMSAKEYVECYHPCLNPNLKYEGDEENLGEEEKARIRRSYEGLSDVKIVDLDTLAEAWPEEYTAQAQECDHHQAEDIRKPGILPLAMLAWVKGLDGLLQTEYSTEEMEILLQLPLSSDLVAVAKARLLPETELPDDILPILSKIIAPPLRDPFVDLSVWPLSKGQLIKVVGLLPTCKILKLGGKVATSLDEIAEAITLLPLLEIVILFDNTTSIKELDYLRQKLAPANITIAHKAEFLKFVDHREYWLEPKNPPEFMVLKKSEYNRDDHYRGSGIETIKDPNVIVQGLLDASRLGYGMTALSNCFLVNTRSYGEPFASSTFLSHGAVIPRLEQENKDAIQWIFVLLITGYPWKQVNTKYGFIRHQPGSPLQVMDLDGFVMAISKERPDLPPIAGWSHSSEGIKGGPGFTSFVEELRHRLGPVTEDDTKKDASPRVRYELWTVEEAEGILVELSSLKPPDTED